MFGCGGRNNEDWIWWIIIIFVIFCVCGNGLGGCDNNCGSNNNICC